MGEKPSHTSLQHLPALDGLRGLAASIVIVSHVSNATNLWGGLLGHGAGQVGVMLFFVLSGYLMGFLYLHRPFSKVEAWNYTVHRGARVLPLFYAAIIFGLVLAEIGRLTGLPLEFYKIDSLPMMLALVKGSDVFWTIPIEIQFYAIFVGVWGLYALSKRAALITVLALSGFSLAVGPLFPFTVIYHLPFFLCGVIVSQLLPLILSKLSTPPWSAALATSFIFFLLMFSHIAIALFGFRFGLWTNPVCIALAAGCLLAALCSPKVEAILSSRPMIHLGKVSYSLYLLHMPIILLLMRTTPLERWPALFLLVAFLLTTVVSTAIHRLFEAPARRTINERFGVTELAPSLASMAQ